MRVWQAGKITMVRNGGEALCLAPDATGLTSSTNINKLAQPMHSSRSMFALVVRLGAGRSGVPANQT